MATYTLTVLNKNGSYDGDMVVRQYTSLTINNGNILTTDQPCRGLFIYVSGDCVINGSLSMTARGAFADPTVAGASDASAVNSTGLRYGFTISGIDPANFPMAATEFNGCGNGIKSVITAGFASLGAAQFNKTVTIPRTGAAQTATLATASNGITGNAGVNGQTGSGGTGAVANGTSAGPGGAGTCFSGGAGSGGTAQGAVTGPGSSIGGPGGNGLNYSGGGGSAGGAGNPGGAPQGNTGREQAGGNGIGGLLWLVVGGNLTIGASGTIEAKGVKGGDVTGASAVAVEDASGGGSGGGSIVVAYKGTFTNNGSITAAGGLGGLPSGNGRAGGAGGAGSVQIIALA
jgi:hypothetical protein